MSGLLGKISKIWLVNYEPFIEELCMPIFRPLALLVWEENEVTDGRTRDVKHSWPDPFTKFSNSPLASLVRDKYKKSNLSLKFPQLDLWICTCQSYCIILGIGHFIAGLRLPHILSLMLVKLTALRHTTLPTVSCNLLVLWLYASWIKHKLGVLIMFILDLFSWISYYC